MNTEAKDQLATLLGGSELTVTRKDGTTETVKIRKVPIEEMPKLAQIFGQDMRAEAAFYADKEPAWIDTLTDESFAAVFEEGRSQNFTLYAAWFRGKAQELELMARNTPNLTRIINGAVEQVMARQPGGSASPRRSTT